MSTNVASGGAFIGLYVYDENRDSNDLNTRILAIAVICLASVVVLMVFIHLYVRHVLLRRHRAFRFFVSNLHDIDAAAAGLDLAAIAALPALPYQKAITNKDGGEGAAAECTICLSAVEEAEVVRILPNCGHLFHVSCIDRWLGSQSTCPVCRAAVVPSLASDSPDASALEAAGPAPASQEATSSASKDIGPASSRLGSSFRRILSWERSTTGRRAQGEGVEDLERQ